MWVGRRYRVLLLVAIAAACVVLPFTTMTWAQDSQGQQSSVADAARRAKQKKNAAKGSKVIDDDNLSSNLKSGGPDVTNAGASAAATVNPGAAANAQAGANSGAATGDQAALKDANQSTAAQQDPDSKEQDAEIAKVKEQVAETEKELDLLKRGLALDSEAYYSKTDYASDKAGKAKLDDEQQQVAGKQQEFDGVKAHLAELLEQRRAHKAKPAAPTSQEAEKPSGPPQR